MYVCVHTRVCRCVFSGIWLQWCIGTIQVWSISEGGSQAAHCRIWRAFLWLHTNLSTLLLPPTGKHTHTHTLILILTGWRMKQPLCWFCVHKQSCSYFVEESDAQHVPGHRGRPSSVSHLAASDAPPGQCGAWYRHCRYNANFLTADLVY